MQVYLYLRVYKKDRLYIKGVVSNFHLSCLAIAHLLLW